MNYIKLNELAAKVMGWTEDRPDAWDIPGEDRILFKNEWNPCEDLNDASALLEKVVPAKNSWAANKLPANEEGELYWACTGIIEAYAPTEALAKTLCALRASDIPESSITEATK